MISKNSYVYIITNKHKTVLYIGVTADLSRRLSEHKANMLNGSTTFAAKYNAWLLLYYEHFNDITIAINRETQLKNWNRSKKINLIKSLNPNMEFLNGAFHNDFLTPI